MDRITQEQIQSALPADSMQALTYVAAFMMGAYGICCPATVAINLLGNQESVNCDGHNHGLNN